MRSGSVCLLWLMVTGCGLTVVNDNPPPFVRAEQLTAGTRVRVHSESHGRVIGHLARVSADSIVLRPPEEGRLELALPVAAFSRVDISVGRRSRKGRGALIGLLGGAAASYAAMLKICEDACVSSWIVFAIPIGGVVAGAGIGAVIGSQIKTERWLPVSWF